MHSKRGIIKRGDIVTIDLSYQVGSVQRGTRPAIVVSNDLCNKHSPVITIVPVTAKITKPFLPTHLELNHKEYKLRRPSIAIVEQINSVDKEQIIFKHKKRLNATDMAKIDDMLKIQLGISG